MRLKYTIKTAVQALSTHKSRSFLTILGIVIGVAAIMIVMALGQGAEALILGQISNLGAETAVIRPGGGGNSPEDISEAFVSDSITERDLDALLKKSNVPNLVDAMPIVVLPGTVKYENESYRTSAIGGVARFFVETFDLVPREGAVFGENEIEGRDRVALIGASVKEELFGSGSALGKDILIAGEKFRVMGVLPRKGSVGVFNVDDTVMVPYTAAQTYVLGTDHFNEIIVRADLPENVNKMVFDIEATLRETHDIRPGEEADFNVQTQQGLVEQVSTIVTILTAFLSMVVAVSLVVGGIGIMNIMLVSVSERTKEIGLRKALGATRGDILRQFLYEAVILTGLGGIIGVILGTLVSYGAAVVLSRTVTADWEFVFPVFAVILGVGVSGLVGLVFGIYPAGQAAKKSPIEALRYE